MAERPDPRLRSSASEAAELRRLASERSLEGRSSMPGQAGAEAIIGGTESKRHDPIYGPYLPQYDDLSSPLGWAPWVTWWVRRQRRRAAQEPREPRNPVDQPTPV